MLADAQYTRDQVWGPMSYPARDKLDSSETAPWKDHIYLAFWDPVHEAYGFLHWNSSPNHNTGKSQATVMLGGEFYDVKEPLPASTTHFSSPSIDYDLKSHIQITGKELQGSLEVLPRIEPVDYTGYKKILPELIAGKPLNHWQQGLHLKGHLTLRGKTFKIDALGFRTRTWGFRDDSQQFHEYFSLFACFENFDVSIMKFLHVDGSVHTDGALVRKDGTSVRFDDIHLTRDSAGSPLLLELDLVDGTKLLLKRVRRTATMWCPIGPPERKGPTFCAFDEFIEWEAQTGERGMGLNEQGIIRRIF
ncbi:hypothetical protein G7048_26430 (plasmid) [Diaphorobacter sp. HDW4B]|uniref:hypothetical protein n=1 Tax=Diaphorobacter sp. HDW4B TaxID=2714925 RepID=UPI00140760C1|nr:hypothetical protein [Diaphorobacter sp. HDW4B]QIL74030.1 hypothetical protein G7048_26430 [Diaphorobacter sp. HDW4B]